MSMHHSPRHPERLRRARKRNMLNRWTWVGVLALIAVVAVGGGLVYNSTKSSMTCTVESKERTTHVRDGESTQQKLVYTKDCGTLTVDDSLFQGSFNSADLYGQLQEGQKYDFEVIGWRNGFLSQFPNILEAHKVSN